MPAESMPEAALAEIEDLARADAGERYRGALLALVAVETYTNPVDFILSCDSKAKPRNSSNSIRYLQGAISL